MKDSNKCLIDNEFSTITSIIYGVIWNTGLIISSTIAFNNVKKRIKNVNNKNTSVLTQLQLATVKVKNGN